MVVDDLHVFCAQIGPTKTDPVLIINSNRMLPAAVSAEFLQVQTRKRQRPKGDGRVQSVERAPSLFVKFGGECLSGCLRILSVEDVFGAFASKRDDQMPYHPSVRAS